MKPAENARVSQTALRLQVVVKCWGGPPRCPTATYIAIPLFPHLCGGLEHRSDLIRGEIVDVQEVVPYARRGYDLAAVRALNGSRDNGAP